MNKQYQYDTRERSIHTHPQEIDKLINEMGQNGSKLKHIGPHTYFVSHKDGTLEKREILMLIFEREIMLDIGT